MDLTGSPVDAINGSGTDNRIPVTLAAGETDTGNTFIDEQYGSISGRVLVDINGDNVGDTPIAGVLLTLRTAAGATLGTSTTDTNGSYAFNSMAPGAYVVIETQPPGYDSVTDTDGGTDNQVAVTVHAGAAVLADFARVAADFAVGGGRGHGGLGLCSGAQGDGGEQGAGDDSVHGNFLLVGGCSDRVIPVS